MFLGILNSVLEGILLQRIWDPNSTYLSVARNRNVTVYHLWGLIDWLNTVFNFCMMGETWCKSFKCVSSSIFRKLNQSAFPNLSSTNKFTYDKFSPCSSQSLAYFLLPEVFFFFLSRCANNTERTIVLCAGEFIFVILPRCLQPFSITE